MQRKWQISRRTLLRGIGASLALPQLEIMGASVESSGAPKRLVSIFQPNGVAPGAWDVDGVGTNFRFSPILKPLESLRDDIVVISGLNNQASGGHVTMTGSFLTGVSLSRQGKNAPSLDQQVAEKIGGDTKFPSLVLGTEAPRQGSAGGRAISLASTVSWSSATTRISPEISPRVAFDRMFKITSGPEAIRNAEIRKSVIDLVLEDAKTLRRKASNLDKHKIDDYLESVRSVERQMDRTIAPVEKSWTPPTSPAPGDIVRPEPGLPVDLNEHINLMMDLIVLALWTDNTRVATLMTAHGFSRQNFSFLDGVSGDHHGMSHHKNIPAKVKEYTKVSTWFVERLAYFLNRLKAIDEGNGSLLDNSIVLYGSGMKDGNGHKKNNLPILLAGNGQGSIKTGQHVKVASQPLANLHLTLAQKFGIEDESFNGVGKTHIAEIS
ncbi:MAG: DUF1552 domain-containing protein [Verrucomicrobiales bacterium]|nr:DUF1552 domain-containing protein [Verrucomicrobiales bacterium]